jgi:hypothetical protein
VQKYSIAGNLAADTIGYNYLQKEACLSSSGCRSRVHFARSGSARADR